MNYRCSLVATMTDEPPAAATQELTADERQRLRIVHHRLRNASQAIEALLATEQLKGRWAPTRPTTEAVEGAKAELAQAFEKVMDCHRQLGI